MRRLALAIALVSLPAVAAPSTASAQDDVTAPYKKIHKIKVGGEGGWDYLSTDPENHRLYVSRGNRIVVIDTEKEDVVGEVKDTPGVHGAAVAPSLNRGFTSNGGDDTVTAFDLKTLKEVARIKVGGRPDAIMYDPASNRVFTYNHGSKDATAVDAESLKVVGSVELKGVPEAAVADGKGHVFVNLMDTAEVAEYDAKTLKVLNRFSLAPGQRPTGLALDRKNRRLFSVCSGSSTMTVLDADSGKILATLNIGQGSDGCVFDPDRGLAFAPNGRDGTLTIVQEESPGKFKVAGTVPTQQGARTMTIDPRTHRLYLSSATFGPPPADAPKDQPKGKGFRPNLVPDSFVVVVLGE